MTLSARYKKSKDSRPVSPATAFVKEVMAVTKRGEIAVRRWIAGDAVPDRLTQDVLAAHFGTTAEELFPPVKKGGAA